MRLPLRCVDRVDRVDRTNRAARATRTPRAAAARDAASPHIVGRCGRTLVVTIAHATEKQAANGPYNPGSHNNKYHYGANTYVQWLNHVPITFSTSSVFRLGVIHVTTCGDELKQPTTAKSHPIAPNRKTGLPAHPTIGAPEKNHKACRILRATLRSALIGRQLLRRFQCINSLIIGHRAHQLEDHTSSNHASEHRPHAETDFARGKAHKLTQH